MLKKRLHCKASKYVHFCFITQVTHFYTGGKSYLLVHMQANSDDTALGPVRVGVFRKGLRLNQILEMNNCCASES